MSVLEMVVYACGLMGCVSGAASGLRRSFIFGGLGAGIGFVLGIAIFLALAFPYMWCFTRNEMSEQIYSMSRLGKYLFFPVMVVILIFAALTPWFAVGLFV